jgi:hypothetical protein
MKISELSNAPAWLVRAITENADIEIDARGRVVWRGGDWHGGVWRGGVWHGGVWHGGDWRGGVWRGGDWRGGVWRGGDWRGGVWRGGDWHGGDWRGGVWRGGDWRGGVWRGGDWHGGDWHGGGLIAAPKPYAQPTCEIATKAKALLDPEHWIKGADKKVLPDKGDCFCLAGAVLEVGGTEEMVSVVRGWNDADQRTLADVHAWLDQFCVSGDAK